MWSGQCTIFAHSRDNNSNTNNNSDYIKIRKSFRDDEFEVTEGHPMADAQQKFKCHFYDYIILISFSMPRRRLLVIAGARALPILNNNNNNGLQKRTLNEQWLHVTNARCLSGSGTHLNFLAIAHG